MAACAALAAAVSCAGPSAQVPSGFAPACDYGPRIGGQAEMGVSNRGFHTDLDARISMGSTTAGGCVGASIGSEDD